MTLSGGDGIFREGNIVGKVGEGGGRWVGYCLGDELVEHRVDRRILPNIAATSPITEFKIVFGDGNGSIWALG